MTREQKERYDAFVLGFGGKGFTHYRGYFVGAGSVECPHCGWIIPDQIPATMVFEGAWKMDECCASAYFPKVVFKEMQKAGCFD